MKYAMISRIGRGGFGVVLKARAVEVCRAGRSGGGQNARLA